MRPQVVDFDADGQMDIIAGSFGGQVQLMKGAENGFQEYAYLRDEADKDITLTRFWNFDKRRYDKLSTEPFAPEEQSILTSNARAESVTLIDWDGDNDLDLLIGGSGGGLYVRLNKGTAKAPLYETLNRTAKDKRGKHLTVPSGHIAPLLVDWDGDGLQDLVTGSSEGTVYWLKNIGDAQKPSFSACEVLYASPKLRASNVEVIDFNQDGKLDLVIGTSRGKLHVYHQK